MSSLLRALSGVIGGAGAPADLPTTGLVHHWLPDTGVTESGGLVSQWADQVGSRDFAEATNKPTLVASQIDGYSSIRFDGTNDRLNDTSGNFTQPLHVFIVMNQISFTSGDVIFGESGNVNNPDLKQEGASPNLSGPGSTPDNADCTVGTWHLVDWYCDGASSEITVDGGTAATGGTVSSAFTGGLALANRGGTAFGNVEFAEIAIYSSQQTGSTLTEIEDYFAGKYSTLSIA